MTSIFNSDPHPACPTPFNLAEYVLRAGRATPDKVALGVVTVSGAERWSFARLESAVLGTATGLRNYGLVPGDRVLLRLGNTVDFPVAYLGAIAAGLVPIPTAAGLSEPEVQVILDRLTPSLILRDDDVACPATDCPMIGMSDMRGWHALAPATYDLGDPNRLAYVIFTSGTTGRPQAVAHAHRAIWARQMMIRDWYALSADDRLMHAGAFNWTYTLGTGLMDPWTVGATALVAGRGVTHEQLPLLLKRHDVTIFAASPGVYRNVLKAQIPGLPHLRHGLSAGDVLPDATRRAWSDATGTNVFEAFGMTECSTFLSSGPALPVPQGRMWRPQSGRNIAVLGDHGPVPFGEVGEIAVRDDDPGLMLGYLDDPHATAARFRDGWFLTGDLAEMARDGSMRYQGRSDDMMNAGGIRVSPLEVERALADAPGLTDIAVTDVEVKPDVRVIAAFYASAAPLSDAALEGFAAERLAAYKRPRAYQRVDALPRSSNGKLDRRRLRALWSGAKP